MSPAVWFKYKVPVVCCLHLGALPNLTSVVVGPGAPAAVFRWTLLSSFSVMFLLSVTQASMQRLA